MAAKIARFNNVNSDITGQKLITFGKNIDPSSVHKELSYSEKIAHISSQNLLNFLINFLNI